MNQPLLYGGGGGVGSKQMKMSWGDLLRVYFCLYFPNEEGVKTHGACWIRSCNIKHRQRGLYLYVGDRDLQLHGIRLNPSTSSRETKTIYILLHVNAIKI